MYTVSYVWVATYISVAVSDEIKFMLVPSLACKSVYLVMVMVLFPTS